MTDEIPPRPLRLNNKGCWSKGTVPANKGRHVACRPQGFVRKGRKGFAKRPVVVIRPDGSVARRFDGVAECTRWLGVSDRHSVTHACQGKHRCRGFLLMYEEDWSPTGHYTFRPTRGRDIDGRLLPGHGLSSYYAEHRSAETRAAMAERARAQSKAMAADPASRWGKPWLRTKPVRCVTTGETFGSVKAAAARHGIPHHYISSAIRRGGTTHGLKFVRHIEST